MKRVPEWWHWPMGPIGILMGALACIISVHHSNLPISAVLSGVFVVTSAVQYLASFKKKKDTVSWFITWNAFGICACIAVGLWIATMYFAGHHQFN